jgi:hypothetical protein
MFIFIILSFGKSFNGSKLGNTVGRRGGSFRRKLKTGSETRLRGKFKTGAETGLRGKFKTGAETGLRRELKT